MPKALATATPLDDASYPLTFEATEGCEPGDALDALADLLISLAEGQAGSERTGVSA